MRPLNKGPVPTVIAERAEMLTRSFINSGGKTSPWAHEEIRSTLMTETLSKCAYCEAKFLAVSFGDVEHMLPKSLFPEHVLTWSNLTLACSRCNGSKGSKYNELLPFLDPYEDDISEHLYFAGPMIYALTDRGEYTITELDLMHPARIEARDRVIKALESLCRRRDGAESDYIRDRLNALIVEFVESSEYTMAVSSYLAGRKKSPINMK
ncbi:HNH endonuclease [Frigoribacterium sp. NBH87]|uniref:HNH endonuclease n=1 Tax=Frigoribacterium sp. NBH87 TaxID=2596916 RepID=UPI0016293B9F|nr:HNH endonuclease [Frigoribacterium sp. NBH87]QNE42942.1 HNH endonuclease [Frigoribacterium sp. NBH87]